MPSVVNVKSQVNDVELLNVTLSAGTIKPVELCASTIGTDTKLDPVMVIDV